MVSSDITRMSTVELLTLGGDLVPGVKLVPILCKVFTGSEVRGEVAVIEEEALL